MQHTQRRLVLSLACFLWAAAALAAQDWPQWRGPNRDNKVIGFAEPKTWPKELTKKWTVSVGIGEASPVLVGDKLYVFARQQDDEVTLCLDAMTGKEIWQDKYAADVVKGGARGYPGPRSTPAVGEGKVCTSASAASSAATTPRAANASGGTTRASQSSTPPRRRSSSPASASSSPAP
jgi:outer membrane protein assembly factor BamB